MADLQDRRLMRLYGFPSGKDGWRGVLEFVVKAGRVVEEEDHHPTLIISPARDYTASALSPPEEAGYVVEFSTHTHTPLPPLQSTLPKDAKSMRPGVTGKDLKLAEKVEKVFREVGGGRW